MEKTTYDNEDIHGIFADKHIVEKTTYDNEDVHGICGSTEGICEYRAREKLTLWKFLDECKLSINIFQLALCMYEVKGKLSTG